jgi:hypothetical protein
MTPRYAALVAAGLLLVACDGRIGGPDNGPYPPGAATNTLTVQTRISPGKHGSMFTEGAVPEIRLVDADGRTMGPEHDHSDTGVFSGLAAGSYRLDAALRPCDGNCGYLDGPTTPCSATIRVVGDRVVDVAWRVGQRCRVLPRS